MLPTAETTGFSETAALFGDAYELLEELGAGGFGRVFKARRRATGQLVALKRLRLPANGPAGVAQRHAERFRREMALYAELTHPNIVRLLDAGEAADGTLFAVVEYVPGRTLREVLAVESALSWREACHLMIQVLDALACAHARGIVHRDLKPENVMVTQTGVRRNAMVLDFGLGGFAAERARAESARITKSQEMMGTPCYAAPEQLRGEAASTAADLYSWGLVFLECVTGESAIGGASPQDVIHRQLGLEPIVLPAWLRDRRLRTLLERVTAKDPAGRTVRAEELVEALERAGEPTTIAPPLPDTAPDAERRQVTVVCCGMTFASLHGAAFEVEELDHLLHGERAALSEIAVRAGGVVTSALADRIMIVFGYPHAREDDARRAARAAVQAVSQAKSWNRTQGAERGVRLELRVGIHTGLVVIREATPGTGALRDVVGLTPQVAARLKQLARDGEILASADTHRLLRGSLVVEPAGEHRMPELSRSLPVVRILGSRIVAAPTVSDEPEPPLAGRASEVATLTALWERAAVGGGGGMLLVGEPGMGKSRLVRELRRRVPLRSWLECRCLPENQHASLRPLADLLASLDRSLELTLARFGLDVERTLPVLATALGLSIETAPAPAMTPERSKELALDALVQLVFAVGRDHPIVLAIEDLHWADPTTLEFVTLLVSEVASAAQGDAGDGPRVAVVCTARPHFQPPWPVDAVAMLQIAQLARPEVESLVQSRVAAGVSLGAALVDQVVRRAEGVPLFVEEVARMLAESGTLDDDDFEIPASLRDLLAARLDALSPGSREIAQVAAVLGREFGESLLRLTARRDESVVQSSLRELVDAGIVRRRRSARHLSYVFRHALLRDAAYEAMMRSTRRTLHRRAADALRDVFPDVAEQRPDVLAQHYELAGEAASASAYWKSAGDRAMARGAYVEAVRQLERGLAAAQTAPEDATRWQGELAVTESLGTALLATRGYSDPEVERVFERGLGLADRLGSAVPVRVLHGAWGVRITRADRDGTAAFIARYRDTIAAYGDPVSMLLAHGMPGVRALFMSDLRAACADFRRSLPHYDTEGYEEFLRRYGYDGGLYNFGYLAWALELLGETGAADETATALRARAESHGTPYGLAVALTFAAHLARERADVEATFALADLVQASAAEQKMYFWLGPSLCLRGWARARRGEYAAGIADAEQGIALIDAIGQRTSFGFYLGGLVEARLLADDLDAGLADVERGLAHCAATLDRLHEPELLRLRGELLARRGDRVDAEGTLRQALELATRRDVPVFVRRASASLASIGGAATRGR